MNTTHNNTLLSKNLEGNRSLIKTNDINKQLIPI